jgi:hypothetical protein
VTDQCAFKLVVLGGGVECGWIYYVFQVYVLYNTIIIITADSSTTITTITTIIIIIIIIIITLLLQQAHRTLHCFNKY